MSHPSAPMSCAGTRPYALGFGGHVAMQRQPEPSDGKPQFPGADAHSSRRAGRRSRPRRLSPQGGPRRRLHHHHHHDLHHHLFAGGPAQGQLQKRSKTRRNDRKYQTARYSTTTDLNKFQDQTRQVARKEPQETSEAEQATLLREVSDRLRLDCIAVLQAPQAPQDTDMQVDYKTDHHKNEDVAGNSPAITEEHLNAVQQQVMMEEESSPEAPHEEEPSLRAETFEDAAFGSCSLTGTQEAASTAPFAGSAENVEEMYSMMREFLQIEPKFQPQLALQVNPQRGEISAGTRDGAAHVLRCLKVWYDLPSDVLFHAINLLDRFLTKMKVRPCHMSCISVSCMNIAIVSHEPKLPPVNIEDLVSISQCKCTAGDVRRMSAVIGSKLGAAGAAGAVTPLEWLRLLGRLLGWAALHLGATDLLPLLPQESELVNRLEILSCDASCCSIRACELALVLLCTQLDSELTKLQRPGAPAQSETAANMMRLVDFVMDLQRVCQIGDESFYASHQAVVSVLAKYNARQKNPHRQRLVWKLSSRTLKVLRPTDRLTSMLPTIQEQQYSAQHHDMPRSRSGSESSDDLNEESKDWPTSPLVPVLCSDH